MSSGEEVWWCKVYTTVVSSVENITLCLNRDNSLVIFCHYSICTSSSPQSGTCLWKVISRGSGGLYMSRKCLIMVWRGGAGSTVGTCCPTPETAACWGGALCKKWSALNIWHEQIHLSDQPEDKKTICDIRDAANLLSSSILNSSASNTLLHFSFNLMFLWLVYFILAVKHLVFYRCSIKIIWLLSK